MRRLHVRAGRESPAGSDQRARQMSGRAVRYSSPYRKVFSTRALAVNPASSPDRNLSMLLPNQTGRLGAAARPLPRAADFARLRGAGGLFAAMAQIVIEGVNHVYRPPSGRTVLALEDVSLSVGEREFLALLGPSGCGKSTLLYLIGGFLPTETGHILIEGAPVGAPGPDRGIVF